MKNIPLLRGSNFYMAILFILFKNKLPLNYIPYSAQQEIKLVIESIYRPLRGELDINELFGALANLQSYSTFKKEKKIGIALRKKNSKLGLLSKIVQPYGVVDNGVPVKLGLANKVVLFTDKERVPVVTNVGSGILGTISVLVATISPAF
jgi:hypothetical protein